MKLRVSNANTPVWRDITVNAHMPEKLKSLEVLAKNLWWVWNSSGKNLFRDLFPTEPGIAATCSPFIFLSLL